MRHIIGLALVLAAVGCATTPVPADKYARARASIRGAEVANAGSVPSATGYLRNAREELEISKRYMQDGNNERAGLMLLRAEADGNAAMNLARAEWIREDAKRTVANAKQLKAQLEVSQ